MPAVRYVGLIRAIGPLTHRTMSMAALRRACCAAGFADVSTLLATGNVLVSSALDRSDVQSRLQTVVAGFGLGNPVIVRSGAELAAVAAANPFPGAAASRGDRLIAMFLAESPRSPGWLAEHPGPERLRLIGTTLYVDYPTEISAARLAPGRIETRLGVTGTFRNWNTVRKLLAALSAGA